MCRYTLKHAGKLLLFFIASVPAVSFAHVKWFAPNVAIEIEPYSFTDWPVLLWLFIAASIISIGIYIERHGPQIHGRFAHFLHLCEAKGLTIFSILSGLALFFYSTQGFIFAPNLTPEGMLGVATISLQALVGLLLVLGFFVRVAGLLLIALYGFAVVHFGFIEMMDALEIVGIGLFLIIVGRPYWRLTKWNRIDAFTNRYRDYAIPLLRIFTGLNLIALGLSEKILNPELGLAFLSAYDWNFMQMIGLAWYSDYWFVLSAGVVETLLGIVFVLGIVTRFNTLVLSVFFVATMVVMGPAEVVGHTLHFAIVGMLLIFGSGKKLKIAYPKYPRGIFKPIHRMCGPARRM